MSQATRINVVAATVLDRIADRFEEGDGGELLLTCPVDTTTTYDLYEDDRGRWDVVIDDQADLTDPALVDHASAEAARASVARLIAKKIVAAETLLDAARAGGMVREG